MGTLGMELRKPGEDGSRWVLWAWNYRYMVWTGSRCGTLGMELRKLGRDGEQMWDSHSWRLDWKQKPMLLFAACQQNDVG